MNMPAHACRFAGLFALAVTLPLSAAETSSLRDEINKHIPTPTGGAPCDDAAFLRRVSLDLNGFPPSADDARRFLADKAPDKRARLVTKLLASPHYARHLATTLDLMLMERRANKNVKQDEWHAWLLESVRGNKPWNTLAREILSADGADPKLRPAARFALDRDAEPHVLTRDIGRIFFGRDMQCAQCHDHPLVDDYLQTDYHALQAFVSAGYVVTVTINKKAVKVYGEKAGNELTFESVFFKGTPHRTGARIPGGLTVPEPFLLPGEDYVTAPADRVQAVPKFSRRAKLAELATNGTNRAFNENIANRLWAHMLGRGLVHPLDLHHPANPATHPELLTLLGERFAAMNYDVKSFLREIALSNVYQRPFELPRNVDAFAAAAASRLPKMTVRQTELQKLATAASQNFEQAHTAWTKAEAELIPAAAAVDATRKKYADAFNKHKPLAARLAKEQASLATQKKLHALLSEALKSANKAVAAQPGDKALTDAVAKLKQKTDALAAEITKLNAAVTKTSNEIKPHAVAMAAVKKEIDAALGKVKPLRQRFTDTEREMQSARAAMAEAQERLAAHERDLKAQQLVAELPQHRQAIAAAQSVVQQKTADAKTAEQKLTDYAKTMTTHEVAVQTAQAAIKAAETISATATAKHKTQADIAASVQTALASAEVAAKKLPGDAVMAEVTEKLKAKAGALSAAMAEAQKNMEQANAALKTTRDKLTAARTAKQAAETERQQLAAGLQQAKKNVAEAQTQVAAKTGAWQAKLDEAGLRWENDFTLASLKPLTPEQMCWSVFRVTGVYENYRNAERTALDKKQPLTKEQQQDPAALASREVALEQGVYNKLKGNVGTYVRYYGAGAGQPQTDFFATADQALFAANGGSINSWVVPSGDNVTQRMVKAENPSVAAEELYLAILTRMPTPAETQDVTAYLAPREKDKAAAASELVWSLINSAEFRFNH